MSNDRHNGAGRSLADARAAGTQRPTETARPAGPARPAAPTSLAEARRAVEQSRERISATLNELEDRIVDTRESIKRKADVVKPAREAIRRTPLIALGVAVAVGLMLGARGGKKAEDEDDAYGFDRDERRALEEWRKRRRKLLMQEAEEAGESFDEPSAPGPVSRFFRAVGHEVAGVAIGIIAAEVAERYMGGRDEDDDEEFEVDEAEDELDAVYDDD
jgi:ElaB/YqjD/DUF883 family membrane-anchored ribosome-binding protein